MNWIFAGLICAHLDVYFNSGVDLLPDWLGYLLVLYGMKTLYPVLPAFDKMRIVPLITAMCSIVLFGANVMGYLPDAGWPGAWMRFLDYALTIAVELGFCWSVHASERQLQCELDDASLLAAVGVTWVFAILGVILRLVENDIFALLTTMSTALLTLWLFYALWEIVKNYRYTKMQQAFEKNRW